jgi:flagellar hook-associated protein 3 FlgL
MLQMNWYNLQAQRQEQDRLQQQLSSGKRVNLDSDDPAAASEIQVLRRQLAYQEQYAKNAARCDGVLKYADSTLNGASNVLLQVMSVGSQATSSFMTGTSRKNLAEQIRSFKNELIVLANTKYQGEYIFSGTANATAPFTVDPVSGAVTYNGHDPVPSVPVDEGIEVQASVSGQVLFLDEVDLFAEMDTLAAAVEAADGTAIATQLEQIEKARLAVSGARGTLGHQMNTIEQVQEHLAETRVTLQQRISNLEDADMGELVSRLALSETAISATLYAQGRTGQRTLFDFIG